MFLGGAKLLPSHCTQFVGQKLVSKVMKSYLAHKKKALI